MFTIKLLQLSAKNIHCPKQYIIEALGSDSELHLDGRIKNIHTAHEKAFDYVASLKNIRSYAGFNVYRNGELLEINKFKDFVDFEYKQI